MEINFFNPWFFYSLLFGVYFSCRIPYLGVALRVVNTMMHEFSHALVAFLFSGKIQSVKLFSNTEGEVTISGGSKVVQFLTALAGYPLSALSGVGMMYLLMNDFADFALWTITGISAVLLLLFVRNLYGVLWLIGFIGINGVFLFFEFQSLQVLFGLIYSFVILSESVHSVFSLLIISLKNPKSAGDAAVLSKLTFFPVVFWAIVFVFINLFVMFYALKVLALI